MAGALTIKAIGPSYQLSDRKSAIQRAVNLYMRTVEGLGEHAPVVLDSPPGLSLFLDLGATIRGVYQADGDRLFVVAGSTLYELIGTTPTARGTLSSSTGRVSMRSGRSQLCIVDGPAGYIFDLDNNVFSSITDTDFRGSKLTDEIDGYFVFAEPGTDQFYLSGIDDGKIYDGLDFSSADTQPDAIISLVVRSRELYLFGTRSCECWINSGNPDFPLVRYNSTPFDVGIVGTYAFIKAAESIVWVGRTERGHGYVYMMNGHTPQRISTQAVEEALLASTDLSGATLWTYHTDGNEFVGVNAPGLSTTWVYEFSTQQWHEQAELVAGEWTPLRTEFVTFWKGKHYASAGTKLYRMDKTLNTFDGSPIVRERTWPHLVSPSFEPVAYRSLELACNSGAGGRVTLELSNDGGYTFGPPLIRQLGADGRYMQRIRWLMLGVARDRVFRIRCSDPVPFTMHAATVEA